jgi:hypothetical protein
MTYHDENGAVWPRLHAPLRSIYPSLLDFIQVEHPDISRKVFQVSTFQHHHIYLSRLIYRRPKMTIDYRDGVSIGLIAVYLPALAIATYLAVHHGFNRSAGWMFLIIFCLARIIGASMQLATISAPNDTSLYTGYAILESIGLSPLMLAALGLLSRLLESINRTIQTSISIRALKLIEILIMVGFILAIVGGVNAGNTFSKTGNFTPSSLSKVGIVLFTLSYIALVLSTIFIAPSVEHAAHGEKRILTAVVISLPFLLVRLFYSIISTFTTNINFNNMRGSVTVQLFVAFVEELIVVVVFETTALILFQVPKGHAYEGAPLVEEVDGVQYPAHPAPHQLNRSGAGYTAFNIAKKTIIGRMVRATIPSNRDRGGEIRRQYD